MHDNDNGATELMPGFDTLLLAVLPSLRQQAMALTRHRADAEDLVQATVTNALAAQDSFQVGTNFRAWMTRILRNRFFSNVRSRRTMVDLDAAPPSLFGRSGGQEETIAVQELQRHLARLPANQRQILLMISVDGLSYDDASEHLGVAAGTLKCRVFRARAQLQDWMLGGPPSADVTDVSVRQRSNTLASAAARSRVNVGASGSMTRLS
jgi:RNA polymerase sigma-70 factor (ECF subfamily)